MAYFDRLNYTLSNEDTKVEYDLLINNVESVFTICGSGARVLPLVAKNPKNVYVVDLSQEQLYLCELRFEAAKQLDYDEFLFLLGYRGGLVEGKLEGDDRLEIFNKITLSESCHQFWLNNKEAWMPKGFILLGKWEAYFQKISKIIRTFMRTDFRILFEAQSLQEQKNLYDKYFKKRIFRNFLKLFLNEFVMNKFLYKGSFSGNSHHRTESKPPWKFIDDEFNRIFSTTLVRKNYFFQILFLGSILYEEGLPIEAHFKTFNEVKKSNSKLHYKQENLIEVLTKEHFDFISLSDTISYLPTDVGSNILTSLNSNMKPGSKVVIRSYLRTPKFKLTKQWVSLEEENKKALLQDGTGVYKFHIFEKKANL